MKRNLKATVVMLLLLAILTGCSSNGQPLEPNTTENTVQQNPTTEPATDFITEPSDTDTAPTEKENEVLQETEPTEPPETTASTEPSEPEATEPIETEPAVTEPPKADTNPEPTVPTVKPEPTKPTESSTPKPTTPPATEPAKHTHQYTAKVVKPTCTKDGYTVHTCSCGDSYTDSKTAPGEHSYDKETVKPTMWQQGYTVYTCTVCKDSYKDDYINISSSDKKAFIEEVRKATVKHLNKLRVNDGSTSIPTLPKLTKVADYRAKQLQSNYAHSVPDLREALAYYEYGEYLTPEGWDPSEYYYFPGQEAIGRGNWVGTAEEISERIAKGFRNSSGHWAYVGSAKYTHIAVGVSYDPSAIGNYYWKICVFVSTTDQYG